MKSKRDPDLLPDIYGLDDAWVYEYEAPPRLSLEDRTKRLRDLLHLGLRKLRVERQRD